MLINKSNYEAFALDYLEGNLPTAQVQQMELFLAAQPAIAAELEAMRELVRLTPDTSVVFESKDLLLKPEAAVVFWMQPLFKQRVAAAAVALLLLSTGYFMGKKNYQVNDMPIAKDTPTEHTISPSNKPLEQDCLEAQLAVIPAEQTDHSGRTNTATQSSKINRATTSPQQNLATSTHFDLTENTINTLQEKIHPPKILKDELITEQFTEAIAVLNPLPSKDLRTVKSAITTIDYVYINDVAIHIETNKTSKRIRSLLGTLPFEDVKLANFVPTYYSDNVAE